MSDNEKEILDSDIKENVEHDFIDNISNDPVDSAEQIDTDASEMLSKAAAVNSEKSGTTAFMNETFDWLESILMAIVVIVVIFTFFVRVNTVSGDSMVPTLEDGEKLLVSDLLYTPTYNDIVIIQAKNLVNDSGELGKPIVKRVIGLPGDKIRIDFINGVVYRNDTALDIEISADGTICEDKHLINAQTTRAIDMTGEVIVPEDCYFVMGDNRNESKDSRDNEIGFVERNYIVGRAFFSIFPFDTIGTLN